MEQVSAFTPQLNYLSESELEKNENMVVDSGLSDHGMGIMCKLLWTCHSTARTARNVKSDRRGPEV